MSGTATPDPPRFDPAVLAQARDRFVTRRRRRTRAALLVPITITVAWLLYVTLAGQWPRVTDRWVATITMMFGSFVAGSTPQGGGAVAFPVFTKVLQIPPEVARTFTLCIQTVGMGSAAASIVVAGRQVERRVLAIGVPAAITTFILTLLVFGDRSAPFWPMRIPGAYVKVTFTLVLAAMALVVVLGMRVRIRAVNAELPPIHARSAGGIVFAAAIGGVVSAMVGSGADVMLYLVVVLLLGLDARVGVPTSVITMAAVSVVGLALLGLWDGQLTLGLSADGATVITVGGAAVAHTAAGPVFSGGGGLAADRYDLFGFWLAAIPAACWFGFLGSYVASRMRARSLAIFVALLAVAEVLSTAIFLTELRTDPWLLAYAVAGMAVTCTVLILLARSRRRIFALPPVDRERTYTRHDLDVAPGFEDDITPTEPAPPEEGER